MGTRGKWIDHNHSRRVIVSVLKISLLEESKAQSKACLCILRVFGHLLAINLLGQLIVTLAYCLLPFVEVLIIESGGWIYSRHRYRKHNGGHTHGPHLLEKIFLVQLFD